MRLKTALRIRASRSLGCRQAATTAATAEQDLVANYTLPVTFADVKLTAAVINIFDRAPAHAYLPLGYNPAIGNGIGRNFRLGAKVKV